MIDIKDSKERHEKDLKKIVELQEYISEYQKIMQKYGYRLELVKIND